MSLSQILGCDHFPKEKLKGCVEVVYKMKLVGGGSYKFLKLHNGFTKKNIGDS